MMRFRTLEIGGTQALDALAAHRESYKTTGEYPFLIGDAEDLARLEDAAEINTKAIENIIQLSANVDTRQWIAECRRKEEEIGFSEKRLLGQWTGEIVEKGAVSLHRDVLTHEFKPQVFIGLAKIEQPWHLPAVTKYGAWNDCPAPEVHCAFHREWQSSFGAEITSMSGDIIECIVSNPPRDEVAAIDLAWHQFWYCSDIVDQGCGSVNNLAATLLNSPYWYFWWD